MRIVELVRSIASKHKASPAQVVIAWVLAQGEHVCPIPGTKRVKYLEENVQTLEIQLSDNDIEELNNMSPAEGARYPEQAMKFVAG